MIAINQEKCTGCEFCIDECPAKIIELQNNKAQFIDTEFCIDCGHCAAICPVQAISSISDMTKLQFSVSKIDANLSDVQTLLKKKRSVRSFKESIIPKELINQILESFQLFPLRRKPGKQNMYQLKEKQDDCTILCKTMEFNILPM